MAQPNPQSGSATARVASCAAVDCRHNSNRACTADDVKVEMRDGTPVCGTYESGSPKARP